MPPVSSNTTTFQSLIQAGNRAWQSVIRGRKKPRRRNIKYVKGVHKGNFYRRKLDYKPPPPPPPVPKLPPTGPAVVPKPLTHMPPPPPASSATSTATAATAASSSEAARQAASTAASTTWEQQLQRILTWLRENTPVLILNFGSLCTLTGFSRQDVLELRALSMTGSLSFVVYQVFQKPLRWAPIAWSVLFASVNGFNITKIVVERKGKVTMTQHEEEVFVEHFMPHGVTPKQFENILKRAEIVHYKKGEPIVRQGELLDKVYLVTGGTTRASIGGRRLTAASTRPGDGQNKHGGDAGAWIGEMAFLETFGKDELKLDLKKSDAIDHEVSHPRMGRAIYNIVALDEDTEVLTWTHDDIVELMHLSTDMRAAMTRAMTAPIVGKVINFSIARKQNTLPTWSIWLDDWKHSGAANVKTTLVQEEEDVNEDAEATGDTNDDGKKSESEDTVEAALEPVT